MNHGGSPVPETQIELKEPLDTGSHIGRRSRLRRRVCEHNFHFKGIWVFFSWEHAPLGRPGFLFDVKIRRDFAQIHLSCARLSDPRLWVLSSALDPMPPRQPFRPPDTPTATK